MLYHLDIIQDLSSLTEEELERMKRTDVITVCCHAQLLIVLYNNNTSGHNNGNHSKFPQSFANL